MAEIRDINPNIFFIVNILSNQFHFNAALGRSARKPFDDDIGPERSRSGRKFVPVTPDDNVSSPGWPEESPHRLKASVRKGLDDGPDGSRR